MRILLNAMLIGLMILTTSALLGAAESPATNSDTLKTVTLNVQKMNCPMCKITIRKALESVDGVKEAKVDYDTKTVSVTFDTSLTNIDVLTEATTNVGYPSTLKQE